MMRFRNKKLQKESSFSGHTKITEASILRAHPSNTLAIEH
jgi:hypothetical protein